MGRTSSREFLPVVLAVSILALVGLSFTVLPEKSYQAEPSAGNNAGCAGLRIKENCLAMEVADTNQARIKGLSDRDGLPANSGMLFVFESAEEQCFWMKDMRFDLDIIWTNVGKQIVKIEPDVSPDTYPEIFCGDDTLYVLEFDAGFAVKHGLKVGDELKF